MLHGIFVLWIGLIVNGSHNQMVKEETSKDMAIFNQKLEAGDIFYIDGKAQYVKKAKQMPKRHTLRELK